jgi:2-polyprenyl-3-methyl-5-hydroxy-6-metoxy-1,4-benzoquinol methylase
VHEETIPIYRDGRHYDLLYGRAYPQFWVDLAQEYGGPVLELACGTGAKAIPLAQSGLDVTGINSMDQPPLVFSYRSAVLGDIIK